VNILRINQFESKFQSMSVLAYDIQERKYYAFLKGAPELIEKHSIVKFSSFDHLVTELSLGGYRSIAYAYKEVKPEEVQEYLEGDRLLFQKDIIALGIVAFENKLKVDTR
jgi:magnesium-transporting ATPase (P-type)